MARLSDADLALLAAALPPRQRMRLAAAGHRVAAFREAGPRSGEVLVMLHGIGGSSGSFGPQFAGLQDRFRVLAWDAPGYAGSTPHEDHCPAVEQYAASLMQLIDCLGVERVHLVASSWGTLTALDFAGRFPDRVGSLTLAGPTSGYRPMGDEAREQLVARRLAPGPDGAIGASANVLVAENTARQVCEVLEIDRRALDPRGFEQATRMLLRTDGIELARRVRCPTLLVAGGVDRVCPPDQHCEPLRLEIAGSVLETFDDCGHIPYLEAPNRFNGLLARFVSSGRAPQP